MAGLLNSFWQGENIMSHTHHSTREDKKKAQHSPKEKRAMKLEKKRASENPNPEIKIVKGVLNPPSAT
jgi:hypothetical protein